MSIPNLASVIDPGAIDGKLSLVDPKSAEAIAQYDDLHRGARTMITVRWVAVPWVLLQILAYEVPFPPGHKALAFVLLALLIVGNVALLVAHRGPHGHQRAQTIGLLGLTLDVFLLSAFVWLFTFDYQTAVWAILFIAPLEGAILFQLVGALSAWGVITVSYACREVWGAARYDNPLLWNSVSFRMGIGGVIALVAGFMARDLLRQRTQLADALAEIRRVDRMRSGLVSTLGHDVRTPLTVIRGVVETLLSRGDLVEPEDRITLLQSADRQARRLENLATDLLDLARLEEGRLDLDLQPVSLCDALKQSLTYVQGAEDIALECDEDLMILAEPRRFEQVVINLAANALHHGAPPVLITGQPDGATAVIEIADRGPGVPEVERMRLFEPFGAERKTGSAGYGLAVVKALVEAQGGTVGYAPRSGGGALFRIRLPRV